MNCEEAQSLLLQSDEPMAPDGVFRRVSEHAAHHVRGCASCRELARKLRRLESAVRSLPGPIGSTEARLRFETALRAGTLRPGRSRRLVATWRTMRARVAIAAMLL